VGVCCLYGLRCSGITEQNPLHFFHSIGTRFVFDQRQEGGRVQEKTFVCLVKGKIDMQS
jgi:hypothetical protein